MLTFLRCDFVDEVMEELFSFRYKVLGKKLETLSSTLALFEKSLYNETWLVGQLVEWMH